MNHMKKPMQMPAKPMGDKNGGMAKGYADGGMVSSSTQMPGFRAPNECLYQNGPTRSLQDYKK